MLFAAAYHLSVRVSIFISLCVFCASYTTHTKYTVLYYYYYHLCVVGAVLRGCDAHICMYAFIGMMFTCMYGMHVFAFHAHLHNKCRRLFDVFFLSFFFEGVCGTSRPTHPISLPGSCTPLQQLKMDRTNTNYITPYIV